MCCPHFVLYFVSQDDRVAVQRLCKVGTIEVVRSACSFAKRDWYYWPDVEFDQANKKDATNITSGKYVMSTTKKGRCIEQRTPTQQLTDFYNRGPELGRLSVHYHMGHTLEQDFNIKLTPVDWLHGRHASP